MPQTLGDLAPGHPLRDGLDRIVRGHTGALVILGMNSELQAISTGGFAIDVEFTATGLRELAKMDGAIVLSDDHRRILAAAVHLTPSADWETSETGTRHRTAERVAKQTGLRVVTVSASMGTISLFDADGRHVVPGPDALINRASQAIAALSVQRERLLESLERLTSLEVQDGVTLRDLAHVAQRFEMTNRLADEASSYVTALGVDGRLPLLQMRDLVDDLTPLSSLIQRDYEAPDSETLLFAGLGRLDDAELFDIVLVARTLGFTGGIHLDSPLRPKGYRALASIPRLPSGVMAQLVEQFGTLTELFAASPQELMSVPDVTLATARLVRDGLTHIAERTLSA